jgi:chromosome segregation ATPase
MSDEIQTAEAWKERIASLEERRGAAWAALAELGSLRGRVALDVELGRLPIAEVEKADAGIQGKRQELERIDSAIEAAEGQLREAEEREHLSDLASRNGRIEKLGKEAEQLAAELQERLQEIRGTLLRFGEISDELRTLRGRRGEAWESFHPNGMGVFLNSALQWELRGLLPGLQTEKPPTRTLEEWARGWTAYMIDESENAA